MKLGEVRSGNLIEDESKMREREGEERGGRREEEL